METYEQIVLGLCFFATAMCIVWAIHLQRQYAELQKRVERLVETTFKLAVNAERKRIMDIVTAMSTEDIPDLQLVTLARVAKIIFPHEAGK